MRDGPVIARRYQEIVHFERLTSHSDFVARGMSMGRLLVRDMNNTFDNLTHSIAIDPEQTVGLRKACSPKWKVRD